MYVQHRLLCFIYKYALDHTSNRKPNRNISRIRLRDGSKGIGCFARKKPAPSKSWGHSLKQACWFWKKFFLFLYDTHSLLSAWMRLLVVNKTRSQVLLQFIIVYLWITHEPSVDHKATSGILINARYPLPRVEQHQLLQPSWAVKGQ